jgi:hypothetical protein
MLRFFSTLLILMAVGVMIACITFQNIYKRPEMPLTKAKAEPALNNVYDDNEWRECQDVSVSNSDTGERVYDGYIYIIDEIDQDKQQFIIACGLFDCEPLDSTKLLYLVYDKSSDIFTVQGTNTEVYLNELNKE